MNKFFKITLLIVALFFVQYAALGAEMTDEAVLGNDRWSVQSDGDLVPNANTYKIGSATQYPASIWVNGAEYTSFAAGTDGNWTDQGTTTTLDACPTKIIATHSTGNFQATQFGVGTSGILGVTNGQTLTVETNNAFIFGDNSDTATVTFSGDDVVLDTSDGGYIFTLTDATDGTVDIMANNDANDYISFTTVSNVPTIVTAGSCNLEIAPDGGTLAVTGILTVSGAQTLTGATTATSLIIGDDTYDVVTDDQFRFSSNDEESTIEAYGYEAKDGVLQLSADQGDDAGDKIQLVSDQDTNSLFITSDTGVKDTHATIFTLAKTGEITTTAAINVESDNATTNAVSDVLNLQHFTTGTAAAGIGAGLTFDLENDATTEEEHVSIDAVATAAADGAEYTDVVISQMTAGAVSETLRLVAGDAAAASDYLQYTANTSETNGIVDVMVLKLDTSGTPANNLGAGISVQIDDATPGVEEQASIDFQVTDSTTTAENCDMIASLNTIGTIREVLQIDTDCTATDCTLFQLTSWTIETNGVMDMLELNLDNTADTADSGFGAGISIVMEQADSGTPVQQASVDFVMVDSTTAAEDCDVVISQDTAGAVAETLRLVANSSATTSDYLQFTGNTTETNGLHNIMVLKTSTGTATDNYGISISFQPEDATGSEEVASLDIVETTAARATNDTDFVFSQNINGTITETFRINDDVFNTMTNGLQIADDMDLEFGTNSDWAVQYDEAVDNQLIFLTAGTGCAATTDPMFEVIVGASPTANQEVFGISKGTQASNTALFTVDEDGDAIVTGSTTFTGGVILSPVAVTDAATYAILAANSGKLHMMPNLTADDVLTLPTAAAGLNYRFVYGGAAADAQDWTFDTGADANFFYGGLVGHDPDDGDVLPIYADGNSNSKVKIDTPAVGTFVDLHCDGTHWILSGHVVSATDTHSAFSDQ